MTKIRTYQRTHPWINFELRLNSAPPAFWMALGECHSKCEHLAGIPLAPGLDDYLHRVYLAKGIAATAAIEGNTLSEEQVLEHLQGKLILPPSQEYLKQEIDNILEGCNLILREIRHKNHVPLTVARIKELNKIVLDKLSLADPDIIPGRIRQDARGVGNYRAAPHEDCEYLVERMCEWLNGPDFQPQPGMEVQYAIIRAIMAHLYIAWIHPFGDGNGRTARLVEVQILLSSGVPSPAAQLLSNHYNSTRSEYYRQLDQARKDVLPFLLYAVIGFRDGLRDQINAVRIQQWKLAWENHVHKVFDKLKGPGRSRQRHLVLDLSKQPKPVTDSELKEVSPRVAIDYADLNIITLRRDLKALIKLDLITWDEKGEGWRARKEAILAFLPVRAAQIASEKSAKDRPI